MIRLSLQQAEFVGVHEKAVHATPEQLIQSCVVCSLPEKLDVLWSFIKVDEIGKERDFVVMVVAVLL